MSYSNKSFSTEDAYRIGKLHCYTDTWENASIEFLLSGGFMITKNIPKVQQETLVLWGSDDQILPVENAYKFQEILPKNQLRLIKDCGHVPHIEKSEEVVKEINDFVFGTERQ